MYLKPNTDKKSMLLSMSCGKSFSEIYNECNEYAVIEDKLLQTNICNTCEVILCRVYDFGTKSQKMKTAWTRSAISLKQVHLSMKK